MKKLIIIALMLVAVAGCTHGYNNGHDRHGNNGHDDHGNTHH